MLVSIILIFNLYTTPFKTIRYIFFTSFFLSHTIFYILSSLSLSLSLSLSQLHLPSSPDLLKSPKLISPLSHCYSLEISKEDFDTYIALPMLLLVLLSTKFVHVFCFQRFLPLFWGYVFDVVQMYWLQCVCFVSLIHSMGIKDFLLIEDFSLH